jgi:hypothetical protein
MHRIRAASVLLAGLLMGCGGGTPKTLPTTAPPHGGSILNLPDGAGFAEVVVNSLKKGETTKSEFSVYFLGPDRTTALAPAPTSATLTLSTPRGERTVELKPFNDALISPPAESVLMGHNLDGTLNVEIGGKPVSIPMAGR